MRTKTAAWAAPLLPLLAAALLLPARGPLARDDVSLADVRPNPIDEQWMDYEQGRKAWMEALEPNRTATSRQKLYDCAERHLLEAAAGPSHFPEAELALGILYYNRNMPYKAETVFQHVGGGPSTRGIARGAIRAEARTYMGALALRCRHWQDARLLRRRAARGSGQHARRRAR